MHPSVRPIRPSDALLHHLLPTGTTGPSVGVRYNTHTPQANTLLYVRFVLFLYSYTLYNFMIELNYRILVTPLISLLPVYSV